LLLALCAACAAGPAPAAAPAHTQGASDGSPLCNAVLDRFVGLPAWSTDPAAPEANALVGRWWIRSCTAQRVAAGLRVRLAGPGWYFVDQRGRDFALREQLPFTLGVELEGPPELTVTNGVAALRLAPHATPKVDLRLDTAPNVRATSAWGSLLSVVPVVSVRDMAAQRISSVAMSALRDELSRGATATYAFGSGQSDVALGELRPGHVPEHAFADDTPWLVNDRLFLPTAATQVVGPIDPGPTRMDVRVERGSGLAYRAVCQADMPAAYAAIASGQLGALAAPPTAGTVTGLGEHVQTFTVPGCKFFIVLRTLGESTTVAALRVRG
jgi:hypothetical protein